MAGFLQVLCNKAHKPDVIKSKKPIHSEDQKGENTQRNNNDEDDDFNLGGLVLGTLPTLTRLKSVGQAYGTRALALIKSIFVTTLLNSILNSIIINVTWKQTNSSLQTVLLGLSMEGGQAVPRPSQYDSSRHPLSSRHWFPTLKRQSRSQHGP